MKKSAEELRRSKGREKLAWLTCYDYPMAEIMSTSGLDAVLVGDSLGEVIYGMETTQKVDLEMMKLHTQAVTKGIDSNIHVISDMPFNTYDDQKAAIRNAKCLVEAGADSVKLENPSTDVVQTLVKANIPVCGHVGLTPQTMLDYQKQGKDVKSAEKIFQDAKRLEMAGCYAMVVEALVLDLTSSLTQSLSIPTIGIASGEDCDGQILVHYDALGFFSEQRKYVKKCADLRLEIEQGIQNFLTHVK